MTSLTQRILSATCLLVGLTSATAAHAQERSAASRLGDFQVGGGFSLANSDYTPEKFRGYTFYTTFDFREHWGVDLEFHQLTDPQSIIYERTYIYGVRYLPGRIGSVPLRTAKIHSYIKAAPGRGVFNFPPYYVICGTGICQQNANLAYNIFVFGGGVDYAVTPRINIRGDFEYQNWLGGSDRGFPHGLSPMVYTVGAAYHFGPGKPHTGRYD